MKDRRQHTMTAYQYLIIGGGMTAAAAVDGIREADSKLGKGFPGIFKQAFGLLV
jgi:hypothetical protein